MYKLLLIRKYLARRRIAWVSLVAVALCVAMVIVVISVMGGWLRMFENSFRGFTGDVIVQGTMLRGFPGYEEMVTEIEKLPFVEAAVPIVKTFGVINIGDVSSPGVQVIGLPIDRIGRVNLFPQSLYLQYGQYIEEAEDDENGLSKQQRQELRAKAEQAAKSPSFALPNDPETYRQRFPNAPKNADGTLKNDPANWPGMIVGSGVVDIRKDKSGKIIGRDEILYRLPVTMTMPRVNANNVVSGTGVASRSYWIVDDARTKLWQYDSSTVYVPFDALQQDLDMGERKYTLRDGTTGVDAKRCHEIFVKTTEGYDANAARDEIEKIVKRVQGIPDDVVMELGPANLRVLTWRQSQAVFIGAVENEKSLVTTLLGFISLVAIFLIFCILYMIVVEKTRDIGIIKSVGATGAGIMGIFLGYGLAIGIVGSAAGLGIGYAVTRYINEIHTWLGRFGLVIWNPEVYAFDEIPNAINPNEVAVVIVIAILASVIGALVPAVRAARLNPVEALRWE